MGDDNHHNKEYRTLTTHRITEEGQHGKIQEFTKNDVVI